jgi:DNA repair exonuclease SbcCD ATPase subunit
MSCKNPDNKKCTGGSVKKSDVAKEWILFAGELIKASIEGVVEFFGGEPADEKKPDATAPALEEAVVEVVEEVAEIPELEEEAVACAEEEAPILTAKELKQQAKELERAEKLAKKEEKRAQKAEKKAEKLILKAEKEKNDQIKKAEKQKNDQIKEEEKKQKSEEKKLEKQLKKEEKQEQKEQKSEKKAQKRSGYRPKNMVFSETEKRFYDGIRAAVGLGYIVRPRVQIAKVLKRGDGTKCNDEDLGEMDFGVFDLQNRIRVLIEVRGIKRKGGQSRRTYRKVRRLCKKAGVPVVTFWAKYGVLKKYIKERMKDYMDIL